MKHQLIITILGADERGILSEIANAVSDEKCNILDSRQAVYGRDFSLTMIVEGSQAAITRTELKIPQLCQSLDLLSMMKRTSEHNKQNLDHMLNVEFSGVDAAGLIKRVSGFFSEHDGLISAFRQKTFNVDGEAHMKCKLVVSVPDSADVAKIQDAFTQLLSELNLTGKIIDKHTKEDHEHITGWQ